MPKPTCQLNLTLDVPTAEWVERIAREANLRPSGAGRVLLEQRLKLESAGWGIEDSELADILNGVAALNDRDREAVRSIIKKAAA
ncbi:MAG: hypothetical protein KC917_22455 [Candidatus Omnitrophica bacterium]|nr:hypothetical protein [Candidatus Omnitrophota bacterium]MCA9432804.1 hypothetical protein [Candidatus Omnitrophota bacterium]MCA9436029.1 hypothetical protein [Candidatus Omnitrophota bacterium]MCA9444118.1 hypothetical protein [Candidatus Omnitrophota bacterium]MCB9770607.1 hypothetical protein [Candidatus Omnitrophota bacterium]